MNETSLGSTLYDLRTCMNSSPSLSYSLVCQGYDPTSWLEMCLVNCEVLPNVRTVLFISTFTPTRLCLALGSESLGAGRLNPPPQAFILK